MCRIGTILLALVLAAPVAVRAGEIYRLEVDGAIFTPVLRQLEITIEQASRTGAAAILLQLDTPGGALDTTKDIVKAILGSPVPVIVYVGPAGAGAISAGTFITLAAHVAAMAPGTTIGAAHPVMAIGGGEKDEVMEQKTENYAATFIEAIAKERGRNVEWAAEAVRKSDAITADEALEKKVIDLLAASESELLEAIHGRIVTVAGAEVSLDTRGAVYRTIELSSQQRVYFLLSQPTLLLMLLLLGAAGVYLEFTHPGMIVPGTVGVICLLLAAVGLSFVPINYTGVALMALGLGLLGAELFVPSFGALGIGGTVCLAAGALLLFRTVDAPGVSVNSGIVLATVVAFSGFFLVVGTLVVRSQSARVTTGEEAMVGARGTVRRALSPQGTVFVMGEIWEAVLEREDSLESGSEIEVVRIDGLRLVVAPTRRMA